MMNVWARSRQILETRGGDLLLAGLAFLTSLSLYRATLAPGLSYASIDGNELITICATLGLAHSTGYPLYTWLGRFFSLLPIATVAYRVNLMSAVLGAAAVALTYGIMRLLVRPRAVAWLTALLFAFSRAFWSQAVIAEVYTPNLFWVALTLLFFLLWEKKRATPRSWLYLWVGFLALGLSAGMHMSNLGFLPAYGFFVPLVEPQVWRRPRVWLGAGGCFLLGLLQYLWLPYKAENLTDALMKRNAPTTWEGFYRYTLGAFSQMKFAFGLSEIPERIVLYLDLLRQNVGWAGIPAGLYGLVELLRRRTARFYLLIAMYLLHVVFFIQYRVFDLEVFFIPAHWLYTLAIGCGVACLLEYLRRWRPRPARRWLPVVALVLLLCLLAGGVVGQALGNYAHNDRSGDTAVDDFYRNVFRLLPKGSVLLGRSGVFGYDIFYYRLVEGVRPDLEIPLLEGSQVRPEALAGREVYTTLRPAGGARAGRSRVSGLPAGAWYSPILLGGVSARGATGSDRSLVLYRVQREPPALVVEEATPQVRLEADLDGLRLLGYTLEERMVEAGGMLHLTLYWQVTGRPQGLIATFLGETPLETHSLGLGNLERYLQEVRPLGDGVLVEEYRLVVPADAAAGPWPLRVGLVRMRDGGPSVELAMITVTAP